MAQKKQQYRILTGLDFAKGRAEPGDVRDDLPESSIGWLVEQGHIEEVSVDGD